MKEMGNITKTMMVLMMNKKMSMFVTGYCYLVFTNEELVVAYLNKTKEKDLFNMWQDENKNSEYALSQLDFKKYLYEYGQRYYDMLTKDILKEDEMNALLRHIDMIRMWFKACKKSDSFMAEEVGTLTIQTAYKKLKFKHHYRDWNRNIYNVLSELYGGRLEYIEGDMALSSVFKEGRKGFY